MKKSVYLIIFAEQELNELASCMSLCSNASIDNGGIW